MGQVIRLNRSWVWTMNQWAVISESMVKSNGLANEIGPVNWGDISESVNESVQSVVDGSQIGVDTQ